MLTLTTSVWFIRVVTAVVVQVTEVGGRNAETACWTLRRPSRTRLWKNRSQLLTYTAAKFANTHVIQTLFNYKILLVIKTFCLCFYDIGQWCNLTPGAFAKLQSAYVKCVKTFFRHSKFYSVTMMLIELALPWVEEIAEKIRCELRQQMSRFASRVKPPPTRAISALAEHLTQPTWTVEFYKNL